ncbi:mannose-1-phosphate guanylyltransferase/mannose-6-phosphate isomerase [Desulfosudis oleivorans]|uniref:mannose-1-phosphate guanylyltransferase n=1 Tax=Desulfosudis oleivorans (strain DSM 6200 / JCM 39069 / Hxd3) TaxID=96561 RepID=A8ZTF2_DESOH|nr:mannose-1-phosphate guanylyltransferase/mannose-6-phosphate isomerase [Desulfosudis oleivorans]ABW67835.1 mannose-1-phosphate guanylyltransferase/mannose-6-phosphate isomerase [Desulfosudis oleivorans Hxd3]
MIIPVVLAGGSGTRLWPLSRELYPKQLMALVGDRTMLQSTLERLSGVNDMGAPIVICNGNHRFMVAEQLRLSGITPRSIMLEPVGRNTAPAIAVAALTAVADHSNPILLVLPADHFIVGIPRFHDALNAGQRHADEGALVTFGVAPTTPETGYGYIKKGDPVSAGQDHSPETEGAARIEAFVEKPDAETARAYLRSGRYFWNSGMFMFRAADILDEMRQQVPEIVAACEQALSSGCRDLDFFRLDADAFARCPSDSIDYAVMEKTDRGVMVPLDAGWNDLGSWEALWHTGEKDKSANVISGDVVVHDVSDSYLRSTSRLLAAVGLSGHVVVETPDAVLICPRNRTQDLKLIVDTLKAGSRAEAMVHKTDYRPWGTCETLVVGERFHVNRLTVKPGQQLALQRHTLRAEHWVILSGTARVTKGRDAFTVTADQSVYIPEGVAHRLENAGDGPLEVIEVQTGTAIQDTDIERLEDVYGRK